MAGFLRTTSVAMFGAAAVAVFVWSSWILWPAPDEVVIKDKLHHVQAASLERLITDYLQGASPFSATIFGLRQELLAAEPWLADIQIRRWLSALEIRLKERQPLATFGSGYVDARDNSLFYPQVRHSSLTLPKISAPLCLRDQALAHFDRLRRRFADFDLRALEYRAPELWRVQLQAEGRLWNFVVAEPELSSSLQRLDFLLAHPEMIPSEGGSARFDLRHQQGVAVLFCRAQQSRCDQGFDDPATFSSALC